MKMSGGKVGLVMVLLENKRKKVQSFLLMRISKIVLEIVNLVLLCIPIHL